MKANKAPKKIWIDNLDEGFWFESPAGNKSVEYVRADAFIEKAVKWLKHSLDNGCWIANDVGKQEKDAIVEHFKETIKLKE